MTQNAEPHAIQGAPSYIELGVEDADRARAFYGALFGWRMNGAAGPGQASTGGLNIGIHDHDPSSLLEVFFTVNDLDSAIAKVAALGGRIVGDIHAESAEFGRWVECDDDQGVRFGLRQPAG
ncbi:VOC family protein [Allobranchiibius sp. GilTou38]|uniref:VOC family protein n=1 Tax=Allobranchiibius sp. GilTou38 TaxID=2815210 RepID=UPI001AA16FB1|nr:VOC family protein [Allobranchiibius sp. GilTou38]MBO1767418.1 VOC family protein [Allobranchiibius sp. GilTou38]